MVTPNSKDLTKVSHIKLKIPKDIHIQKPIHHTSSQSHNAVIKAHFLHNQMPVYHEGSCLYNHMLLQHEGICSHNHLTLCHEANVHSYIPLSIKA